jgi:hypothetical protein
VRPSRTASRSLPRRSEEKKKKKKKKKKWKWNATIVPPRL